MPDRDAADVERMRRFITAVMRGEPLPAEAPSVHLLQIAHLGPMAFRMGRAERRDEYAASLVMADRRARTLREVAACFATRGIELCRIKGSAFAGTIYPDPAERPMHDIDVLVRVERLEEAIDLILGLGFVRVGVTRKLSGFYHAVVFCRGDIMFELHRSIVQRHRTQLSIASLWERSTPDPLVTGARRLDRVDDLIICALHIARHELAVPAISYVDVSRLWHRLDAREREVFHERATAYRITRSVRAVLSMTEHLTEGATGAPDVGPGSGILPTTDDVILGTKPQRGRQIAQKLLLTEGARERVGLGYAWVAAIVEGWWRGRTFDQR